MASGSEAFSATRKGRPKGKCDRDAAAVNDLMQVVDKCGLPGKFEAWIYQHGILSISRPLLV
ncbi:hypothetical protein DPMN_101289 [Dreissena polymorpha]|uniref:Uncharacterized protein n=1 Tax=Dreissena polymorpha TaxID=45954 RepID=A0A9D4LIU8_DREPO|nr:hypothetical protein DPMN_101289 [Dreissena polymorpha]